MKNTMVRHAFRGQNIPREVQQEIDLYYKSIKNYKVLSADEFTELFDLFKKGDEVAERKLIESNLKLVAWIAQGYIYDLGAMKSEIGFSDLAQEGYLGLRHALKMYDPAQAKFSTYAAIWINQSISRFLMDAGSTVRYPVYIKEQLSLFRKVCNELIFEFNKRPSMEDIAERMEIPVEKAYFLQALVSRKSVSLDQPVGQDDDGQETKLSDMLPDQDALFGNEADESFMRQAIIKGMRNILDERTRKMVDFRFGLTDQDPKTLEEIGQMYGLTRERVRQILEKAFKKLQQDQQIKKIFLELFGYFDLPEFKPTEVSHSEPVFKEAELIPYDYQVDCLQALHETRSTGNDAAYVVMASGTGKTVVTALDVVQFKRELKREPRVLYLCHLGEVLEQAERTFRKALAGHQFQSGFFTGLIQEKNAQYLFATFQMMTKSLHLFNPDDFDYIAVDEKHHTSAVTFAPVVEYFKPKFLLGMTATDFRMDLQNPAIFFNENKVYSLDLAEALARGLLTNVDYRLITDEFADISAIENPYGITKAELNKRIFIPRRDEEIMKIISEKIIEAGIKNPKMMIFAPSIKYAEGLAKKFPSLIPIHSKLGANEERERLERFRKGKSESAIITIDKFNEGLDIPEVNVVVFLRSTASANIFWQQLGRGLRPLLGKEKVLALDFVANCERIEMIYELVGGIKKALELLDIVSERPAMLKDELVVEIGSFSFTEVTKDIINLLNKVKEGYPKEVLIQQLKDEAELLKTDKLTTRDIDKAHVEGRTASSVYFFKVFGSFINACKAAGLKYNRKKETYTRETIINQLKAEAELLGKKKLSHKDIVNASKEERTASVKFIISLFGNLNTAFEAAELEPLHKWAIYTEEEILANIKEILIKHGRVLTAKELKALQKEGELICGVKTIKEKLGVGIPECFVRAYPEMFAGKDLPEKGKIYSEKELIESYQAEMKLLGKETLTGWDIKKAREAGRMPSASVYYKRFGGIHIKLIEAKKEK